MTPARLACDELYSYTVGVGGLGPLMTALFDGLPVWQGAVGSLAPSQNRARHDYCSPCGQVYMPLPAGRGTTGWLNRSSLPDTEWTTIQSILFGKDDRGGDNGGPECAAALLLHQPRQLQGPTPASGRRPDRLRSRGCPHSPDVGDERSVGLVRRRRGFPSRWLTMGNSCAPGRLCTLVWQAPGPPPGTGAIEHPQGEYEDTDRLSW